MMNLLALCLVFTSLLAAEVWSPSPVANQPQKQQVEDVIEKEGHRVIVVETYDENGHHNTKVSISPEQPRPQQQQRQEGSVKFKSPSLVEKAKEKMEEACDYALPNIGQGISHGSDGERHNPTELICDGHGKCRHSTVQVLSKATDKVSEVAHDVEELYKKQKEMVHEVKDKVGDAYEKAKETASEKAHEAKECVEDAYEKEKEKIAEKAYDVKESAQESLKKAKGTVKEAKDLGKTISFDVVHNITEKAKEIVKKGKESTKHATNRIRAFVNHAIRYISEAVTSLMAVVSLLGFAIAYGMCVWATFISSYVLARALPRQQFGLVQSKIYPVYFTAMACSIGLALLGHLLAHRRWLFTNKAELFQAYNLLASVLMVLVNLLYLEPLAAKAMFTSMKIEKEEGRGKESPTAEPSEARHEQPVTDPSGTNTTRARAKETTPTQARENREKEEIMSRIRTASTRLKTLNSYSSFLNILTLMALTWHLVYSGQRLHLPVAC